MAVVTALVRAVTARRAPGTQRDIESAMALQ